MFQRARLARIKAGKQGGTANYMDKKKNNKDGKEPMNTEAVCFYKLGGLSRRAYI